MRRYKTAEVAAAIGIHPNTVRLYEKLALIPSPMREANGYRVFTDLHIEQIKLARLAFRVEVLQNGLRKKMIAMVKAAATGDYGLAITLTNAYLEQVRQEQRNAEEAVRLVRQLLCGAVCHDGQRLRRKEVSGQLNITMDTLRNWEMNGLLTVKRKENGYRVYTQSDIIRLKIIRSLKCANYSLAAILRMLGSLSQNPDADIQAALDTPKADDDIITACDRLLTSLADAEANAQAILHMLRQMKGKFS